MSRDVLLTTCLVLAVITQARAQYIDFFSSFLQPFPATKPRNEVTKRPESKHRQTNKQKYQDTIFFETDEFLKQRENSKTIDPFNIYTTTTKPRRKSKTSTTSHNNTTNKPKNVNSNLVVNNNNNHEVIKSISNNNVDNRFTNNGRRIDYNNGYDYNNYNQQTTKAPNIFGQNYNKQTTKTLKTDFYGRQTTHRPNYNSQYDRTTKNPLLNRPGVKPAVIDEDRPPITNRPLTERPYVTFGTYKPPVERRPVNTRPPFETERPISTGVVQPVSGSGTNENSDIDIEVGPDEDEMTEAEKRRLYDICEQKCDEYKSMRVRKVVALPLGGAGARGTEVNVSTCAPDNVPLILGGQPARIETFPHMALVGWKNIQSAGYAWKCGGSLVSERYVLTAGHCTYHDKDYNVVSGPPAAVQLGSAIYNDRTATVARVTLVVMHPKYKLRRSYHDVALLKLAVEVTFSETISPACLGVPPSVGDPIIATGWGKTEYGGDSSIQLRSVSIPIWDMTDCREIWGTSLKLPNGPMPDNQICAGERKGAKDTCQGDSGGPAQVRDGCSWRVVAVTSVGRSCGAPETPALYALVPRAFVAREVYTNIKTGRDGNNQYGNQGSNGNNNGAGNFNNRAGNSNNGAVNSNNGAGNNNRAGNNNNGIGNNNNGFGNNYNGAGNNNNRAENNNGAGNNYWGNVNQNENRGVVNTRVAQNNNGQSYNTAERTPNNYQYNGDSQGSTTDNRGIVSIYTGNSWGANSDNNRYNPNNGNNRNVQVQSYNNNAQTTNGYNQNNFGQNHNNPTYDYNQQIQSVNPTVMRTFGTQSYVYNDNGNTNNGYNGNSGNGFSVYTVASRPWWTR